MIDEAVARAAGGRIGLVASFAPTGASMPREFPIAARPTVAIAEGALAALERGDGEAHDRSALAAARSLVEGGCGVIALAQFSLARAAPLLRSSLAVPVLTPIDSALAALRRRLAG